MADTHVQVDPVFAEIAKAIYGDIDPRELTKSLMPSDVHIDKGTKAEKTNRRIAATGLAATGVASAGGLHAVKATLHENKARTEAAQTGEKVGRGVKRVSRIAHVKPATAAKVVGAGWLGLHGVELMGDALNARAQAKNIKNPRKTVSKAFRLKALNPEDVTRVVSLKAKRPKLTPAQPVQKGIRRTLRNVETATGHASNAAREAAQISRKVHRLIPGRTTAAALGTAGLAGGGAATYTGAYYGTKRAREGKPVVPKKLRRKQEQPVAKSLGLYAEISKVDEDKRQVFGWANLATVDGRPVVDLQGDYVPIDEIEKAAYRYVTDSRKGGYMHQRVSKLASNEPRHVADLIESMVFTDDKIAKMGLPEEFPRGWFVGYQVNDPDIWAKVKSGEITGLSIHGSGHRESVAKAASLRERAEQAVHPPKVRLRPVDSSAIKAMGYQPQTRRLAVEMRSRPDQPYVYRMKPAQAEAAMGAKSKGSYYSREIRGKTKRPKHYTPADRARLFASPQVSKAGNGLISRALDELKPDDKPEQPAKPTLKPVAHKLSTPPTAPKPPKPKNTPALLGGKVNQS